MIRRVILIAVGAGLVLLLGIQLLPFGTGTPIRR